MNPEDRVILEEEQLSLECGQILNRAKAGITSKSFTSEAKASLWHFLFKLKNLPLDKREIVLLVNGRELSIPIPREFMINGIPVKIESIFIAEVCGVDGRSLCFVIPPVPSVSGMPRTKGEPDRLIPVADVIFDDNTGLICDLTRNYPPEITDAINHLYDVVNLPPSV